MNKIFLIVGNGLSIDLCQHLKLEIDPSYPFSFDVPYPFDNKGKLVDRLTHLQGLLESRHGKTDYELIHSFVEHSNLDEKADQWTHCQLRYYLSLAYSHLNSVVWDLWQQGWKWTTWINRYYDRIVGVVSINYDLVLETVFEQLSIKYYRLGSPEEDSPYGIPVFKPHGSCDFDIGEGFIGVPPESRLYILTFLNDGIIDGRGRVSIVPRQELCIPRIEADIVLPFEYSPQVGLKWVQQGYETIRRIAKTVDTCIIVGISYQKCDIREIDDIIEAIPRNVAIVLVDPKPNKIFMERLKEVSDKVKVVQEVF